MEKMSKNAKEIGEPIARDILEKAILPMVDKGIDTIVLGCTHYPFVIPLIKETVGEKINVIDPTDAIVRQVSRMLEENKLFNGHIKDNHGNIKVYTSGIPDNMDHVLSTLFKDHIKIQKVEWNNDLILIK
jgi:glutamate racemase